MRWLGCLAMALLVGGCGSGGEGDAGGDGTSDGGGAGVSSGAGGSTAGGEGGSGVSWTQNFFGAGGADPFCGDPDVVMRYDACRAATDEATCAERGGTWEVMYAGPSCRCVAEDAGCLCTSHTDCAVGCYAERPMGDPPLSDCVGVVAGRCVAYQVLGCWCAFQDGVATGVCIDPF